MIAVHTRAGAYRAAVAELPLSASLIDSPAGAVVVVPGDRGWVGAVIAAEQAGARAVVVADPMLVAVDDLQLLAGSIAIPLVVERPLLRPDVAGDARAAMPGEGPGAIPRTIVIDAAASGARLGVVARDAVGWGRVLAGEAPRHLSGDRGLALLETAGGTAVTLSIVTTRRPGAGWVRAQALGEAIADVDVEGRVVSVVISTLSGRLILPPRYESSERMAVRRALAAVESGESPGDLRDLISDTEPVEGILRSRA